MFDISLYSINNKFMSESQPQPQPEDELNTNNDHDVTISRRNLILGSAGGATIAGMTGFIGGEVAMGWKKNKQLDQKDEQIQQLEQQVIESLETEVVQRLEQVGLTRSLPVLEFTIGSNDNNIDQGQARIVFQSRQGDALEITWPLDKITVGQDYLEIADDGIFLAFNLEELVGREGDRLVSLNSPVPEDYFDAIRQIYVSENSSIYNPPSTQIEE